MVPVSSQCPPCPRKLCSGLYRGSLTPCRRSPALSEGPWAASCGVFLTLKLLFSHRRIRRIFSVLAIVDVDKSCLVRAARCLRSLLFRLFLLRCYLRVQRRLLLLFL